jgi:hypothetical protein
MTIGILNSFRSLIAVPVLTIITLMGTATATAQDESILERLRRLEDREAIHSLLERFFEYQETGNREAYANLFAQNGELILRMGHLKGGPKGIMGSGRSKDANTKKKAPAEPARHILSNVHIELNGDNANVVSRWTMLVPLEHRNRFRLGGSGRYCDKLVREKGEWKILQRIIYCEVPEGMKPVN